MTRKFITQIILQINNMLIMISILIQCSVNSLKKFYIPLDGILKWLLICNEMNSMELYLSYLDAEYTIAPCHVCLCVCFGSAVCACICGLSTAVTIQVFGSIHTHRSIYSCSFHYRYSESSLSLSHNIQLKND